MISELLVQPFTIFIFLFEYLELEYFGRWKGSKGCVWELKSGEESRSHNKKEKIKQKYK